MVPAPSQLKKRVDARTTILFNIILYERIHILYIFICGKDMIRLTTTTQTEYRCL